MWYVAPGMVKPTASRMDVRAGPHCRTKAKAALTLPHRSVISPQADSALLGALIVFSDSFGETHPNQTGASHRAPLPHSTGDVP
jgi:hypothetical protein